MRIVSVAEKGVLGPSPLSLIAVGDPVIQEIGGKVFAVAVIGPTGRRGSTQPAEYARLAAERQGFAVRDSGLRRVRRPARSGLQRSC